jgi:hypothetical protein
MGLRRSMALLALAMAPIIGSRAGAADGPPAAAEQLRELRENTRRAHDAADQAAYLRNSRLMYSFLNSSPRSVLQLMSAEAFAGKQDDALAGLGKFVRMGQSDDAALSQKQFDAIRADARYPMIHAAMIANDGSISAASKLFALKDETLIPEDIDYDPATHRFYITSVFKKEILSVDMNGGARVFAHAPDGWPMMAVKADLRHRMLWATEVALDGFVFTPSKDWGRSALVIYDLDTGRLLHRIEGPPHSALGDMTLTAEGDAIVSDGENGGVYRVDRVRRHFERIDAGDFISPQTPAVLPDGRHILVPDYLRGIGVLDLKSKHVVWLPMEGTHALSGIDGLYLYGTALLATQNGTSPERVIRFDLDSSFAQLGSETIIERATRTLGDPTHGVVVDGGFYYIANSGWDNLDEHGQIQAGKSMSPAVIMRAKLPTK